MNCMTRGQNNQSSFVIRNSSTFSTMQLINTVSLLISYMNYFRMLTMLVRLKLT